jgi:hypothetical protein
MMWNNRPSSSRLSRYPRNRSLPGTRSASAKVGTCGEHANGHVLSWTIIGSTSGSSWYTIYRNDAFIANNAWTSGSPIQHGIDGLAAGVHNFTIVASDGHGGVVQDTVLVTVQDPIVVPEEIPWLMNGVIVLITAVAVVAVVAVVKLRPAFKRIPGRLGSMRKAVAGRVGAMREAMAARRLAPGKVEEVVYRQQPRPPARPTAAWCKACGQPVPAGGETGRFCVCCGKALA